MKKDNILVINSGSSSVKFQVINSENENIVVKGKAEKLGLPDAFIEFRYGNEEETKDMPNANHTDALTALFDFLDAQKLTDTIVAVGHRVVHGGEMFSDSVLITDDVLKQIKTLIPLAPLHNPANIMGIEAITKISPSLPQVAVFDTAFHSTMPAEAYRYSVPEGWYEKHGVRRYGFHGTSYKYIAAEMARILNKKPSEVNLIIAHLGSGASITAVRNGKSVSNTMGFTPLAGLPMGTRSGNIDPGIIPYIMERESLTAGQVIDKLNKESGHKATAHVSDDVRDIITAAQSGNEDAKLAMDIFTRKAAKYIAGFMTMLPSLDALVFTAGIGENRHDTRSNIIDRLRIFGFDLDQKCNDATRMCLGHSGGLVSSKSSKYPVYVLPTNEELMIARDTAKIVRK